MSDRVVTLDAVPALGGLYAKGLGGGAAGAVGRRIGRAPDRLPGVTFEVADVRAEAAALTAYQHLVGETASDALPAGYVHVLAFPLAIAVMTAPGFPIPLVGAVHTRNVVTQWRAARLGEALTLRASARDLRAHRSGTQVDLVTVAADRDGRVVWEGVSTYLAKGVRVAGLDAADDERDGFVAPVPTGRWRLPADEGRRYAQVSGDRNLIHVSRVAARAFGFPRAIAHGMDTAARALAVVGADRGASFTWTASFARPVLLPSAPAVRVARAGAGFEYAVWDAASGKPHLTGAVTPL